MFHQTSLLNGSRKFTIEDVESSMLFLTIAVSLEQVEIFSGIGTKSTNFYTEAKSLGV